MEDLAPPLACLLKIRQSLEGGRSLRTALSQYVSDPAEPFCESVGEWFWKTENHIVLTPAEINKMFSTPQRKALIYVLELGLNGHPIHDRLLEMESEMKECCESDIEAHLTDLPLITLMPLLLLQFPAFLILLLAPFWVHFGEFLS